MAFKSRIPGSRAIFLQPLPDLRHLTERPEKAAASYRPIADPCFSHQGGAMKHAGRSAMRLNGTPKAGLSCLATRVVALIPLVASLAACERVEPSPSQVDHQADYRPRTANDENGRAIFKAGLSLPVPDGASVSYLQGIDSRLMQINGHGFTLQLDDYGAFMGPATATIGGSAATLQIGGRAGCKLRVWRVQLPEGSTTHMICSEASANECKQAPAQATITTFCETNTACREIDAVMRDVRLLPRPWPQMPLPDTQAIPRDPVCRV